MIVTGGVSLIGAAVAKRVLAEGAAVVIADIKAADGRRVADELGPRCEFVHTDLRLDDDIERAVGVASGMGQISLVVNNAAVFDDHQIDTDRATWLDALNVNVVASAMMVQKCRDQLVASGGSVVNVASVSGRVSQPNRLVYNTTKAAILQMTRSMAQELARDGVRVNSVSPGWTWSRPMEVRYDNRADADRFAAEFQPLGRMAEPDEVASAVMFLASEEAAFITGGDLLIDGGYAALGPEGLG